MKASPSERSSARKARTARALSALEDDAIDTVEDFVEAGHLRSLEGLLSEIEELQIIPSLQKPATRCAGALRSLFHALKSVPDNRESTWAERNLPPED